jgi:hypothetical protein
VPNRPIEPSSSTGWTEDGVAWRWRDCPLHDSRLLLYPDMGVPTEDDRWRFEQSLRAFALFSYLRLPVAATWVVPASRKPRSRWTVEEDFFPRWEVRPGDRHAFLFGIVDRLWDCLEFSPQTPRLLELEWHASVGDEDLDDEQGLHAGPGGRLRALTDGVQKLLGKQADRSHFVGCDLPPTNPKLPL